MSARATGGFEKKKNEEEGGGRIYCTAGALCKPPSKCGGIDRYETLPAFPREVTAVPDVPGVEDVVKGEERDQHSIVDSPLDADMVVIFRNSPATFVVAAASRRRNSPKGRKGLG